MINKNEIVTEPHCCGFHPFKRISWTAIFVGAIVGVGLTFLFNLFGLSIGLTAYTLNEEGSIVLMIGGFVGIMIGIIASVVAAGYAAGYLGRLCCPQRNLGIVYGFTTWSVALLLCSIVASQMSNYITSYSNAISHSIFVVSNDKEPAATTLEIKSKADNSAEHQKSIKVTAASSTLAGLAFSVFALFFIGAIASCIGACWGMSCKRED